MVSGFRTIVIMLHICRMFLFLDKIKHASQLLFNGVGGGKKRGRSS